MSTAGVTVVSIVVLHVFVPSSSKPGVWWNTTIVFDLPTCEGPPAI